MKVFRNRALAVLTALCLILSLLPVTALADEDDDNEGAESTDVTYKDTVSTAKLHDQTPAELAAAGFNNHGKDSNTANIDDVNLYYDDSYELREGNLTEDEKTAGVVKSCIIHVEGLRAHYNASNASTARPWVGIKFEPDSTFPEGADGEPGPITGVKVEYAKSLPDAEEYEWDWEPIETVSLEAGSLEENMYYPIGSTFNNDYSEYVQVSWYTGSDQDDPPAYSSIYKIGFDVTLAEPELTVTDPSFQSGATSDMELELEIDHAQFKSDAAGSRITITKEGSTSSGLTAGTLTIDPDSSEENKDPHKATLALTGEAPEGEVTVTIPADLLEVNSTDADDVGYTIPEDGLEGVVEILQGAPQPQAIAVTLTGDAGIIWYGEDSAEVESIDTTATIPADQDYVTVYGEIDTDEYQVPTTGGGEITATNADITIGDSTHHTFSVTISVESEATRPTSVMVSAALKPVPQAGDVTVTLGNGDSAVLPASDGKSFDEAKAAPKSGNGYGYSPNGINDTITVSAGAGYTAKVAVVDDLTSAPDFSATGVTNTATVRIAAAGEANAVYAVIEVTKTADGPNVYYVLKLFMNEDETEWPEVMASVSTENEKIGGTYIARLVRGGETLATAVTAPEETNGLTNVPVTEKITVEVEAGIRRAIGNDPEGYSVKYALLGTADAEGNYSPAWGTSPLNVELDPVANLGRENAVLVAVQVTKTAEPADYYYYVIPLFIASTEPSDDEREVILTVDPDVLYTNASEFKTTLKVAGGTLVEGFDGGALSIAYGGTNLTLKSDRRAADGKSAELVFEPIANETVKEGNITITIVDGAEPFNEEITSVTPAVLRIVDDPNAEPDEPALPELTKATVNGKSYALIASPSPSSSRVTNNVTLLYNEAKDGATIAFTVPTGYEVVYMTGETSAFPDFGSGAIIVENGSISLPHVTEWAGSTRYIWIHVSPSDGADVTGENYYLIAVTVGEDVTASVGKQIEKKAELTPTLEESLTKEEQRTLKKAVEDIKVADDGGAIQDAVDRIIAGNPETYSSNSVRAALKAQGQNVSDTARVTYTEKTSVEIAATAYTAGESYTLDITLWATITAHCGGHDLPFEAVPLSDLGSKKIDVTIPIPSGIAKNSEGVLIENQSTHAQWTRRVKNGAATIDVGHFSLFTVAPYSGEIEEEENKTETGKKPDSSGSGGGTATPAVKTPATTGSAAPAPAVTASSFTDVAAGAYYYDAVQWAVSKGITGGYEDGSFRPNATCTRAQMMTFLWRAVGSPEPSGSGAFTDVRGDAYYAKAVQWAVEAGVTTGATATTFNPDGACTRAQAMTFLWRINGSPAASGGGFSDVASGSYYSGAVAWAASTGVTNGYGNGSFGPDNTCTRGNIVTFLYRDLAG